MERGRGSAKWPSGGQPVLCLVTDRRAARGDLLACVHAAVQAGVDWVQIRDRELDDAALLGHAKAVAEAALRGAAGRSGEVRIIVNRRSDIALAIGADGVHLGFDAVEPTHARDLLGEDALIGVSTHSPDEIRSVPDSANYVQLAPIFDPLSKPASRPPLGLDALARAAESPLPIIAQGGITPESAGAAILAGAAGVAVTGSVLGAVDAIDVVTMFRKSIDQAGVRTRGIKE